jgi:prepilin-type N-terminal cleavage/methylation domain-containing protein
LRHDASGFSLVECLVATAILATAVVGLGQLVAMSAASARTAHDATFATLLAQRTVERWRGLPSTGLVEACVGQAVSAACVEYVDGDGRRLAGGGTAAPAGTAYIVRWSISRSGDVWLMEVRAAALRHAAVSWGDPPPAAGGVRLVAGRYAGAE